MSVTPHVIQWRDFGKKDVRSADGMFRIVCHDHTNTGATAYTLSKLQQGAYAKMGGQYPTLAKAQEAANDYLDELVEAL